MLSRVEDMPAIMSLAASMSVSRKAESRESMDVRLEALEIRDAVDHTDSVDSIDVMLSVSENEDNMVDDELVDSIDVMLSASENGQVMVDGEIKAMVEDSQRAVGFL